MDGPPADPSAHERASTLCRACGFCCDGTIYTCVPVDAEDATRLHLDVVDGAGRLVQPCDHLRGTSCAIYEARPKACARYRCRLLERLDAGEVDLEVALARVEKVKRLRGSLEELLPEGRGSVWDRVARADPAGTIRRAAGVDVPTWVLTVGALRGRLVADFADPWIPDGAEAPGRA